MKLAIDIDGSEGSTTVVMELTPDEYRAITRLQTLVNKTATTTCEPTINIRFPETDEKETQP